jgi:mycoredoxin-dependent peroxiredoxin
MQGFVEAYPEFQQLNARVLAISIDSWAATNAFAESLKAEFPILGDWPLNAVSKAYGVYDDERHVARRTTFVIDPAGVVRFVHEDARDMESHSREALAAVKRLAEGG